MEIIQYSNGPEGAENSFEELFAEYSQAVINSKSRFGYKEAITTILGYDRLLGPVDSAEGGDFYTFDFLNPGSMHFFKILVAQDLSEYERYLKYPGKVTILVNVDDSYWDQSRFIDDENPLLVLPGENEKQIRATSTLLYSFGRLWEVDHQTGSGELVWRLIQPQGATTTTDRPPEE